MANFFIPFVRDYIELVQNYSNSTIQESLLYLFETFKFVVVYFITFQWFRDFIYLPVLIPEIYNSILKQNFFLDFPLKKDFYFCNTPSYFANSFILGFLNSFFLSLPLSSAHFIYLRRFLIQGPIAGIASGLGTIFGQLFFIGSVVLGLRFIIIPWFSFEPINYFFGFLLLLFIVYNLVHERVILIKDWKNKFNILKIFILNFLLTWTEQTCIFQFFSNMTAGSEPTTLNIFLDPNNLNFLTSNLNYLFGLLVGSIFFYIFSAFWLKEISELIQQHFNLFKSTWINRLNFFLVCCILTSSFSSIPFYTFDYLITNSFGFISNDNAFKTTFLDPDVKDPFGFLGNLTFNFSLETDVNTFDRGVYVKLPLVKTYESLNYAGQYASSIQYGYMPLYENYDEKGEQIRELFVKKRDSTIEEIELQFKKEQERKNKKRKLLPKKFQYPTYFSEWLIDPNSYSTFLIQSKFEDQFIKSAHPFSFLVYRYGFNQFFYLKKFTSAFTTKLQNKIKRKYWANPIYKFLLTIDIDTFLKRQPKKFLISSKQEKFLYKKRLILGRYHDSLRLYNELSYGRKFQFFFNGSKSFANRVYNQQFKGTFSVIRQLFSISFNSNKNKKNKNQIILKYDQPLFKDITKNKLNLHEELQKNSFSTSSFLVSIKQSPLYIGWDENLRKIVLTNRILPKSITKFKLLQNSKQNTIEYTAWPIKLNQILGIEIETLSEVYLDFPFRIDNRKMFLPITYYRLLSGGWTKSLSPNRSGFVWPGNSLQFSLKTN